MAGKFVKVNLNVFTVLSICSLTSANWEDTFIFHSTFTHIADSMDIMAPIYVQKSFWVVQVWLKTGWIASIYQNAALRISNPNATNFTERLTTFRLTNASRSATFTVTNAFSVIFVKDAMKCVRPTQTNTFLLIYGCIRTHLSDEFGEIASFRIRQEQKCILMQLACVLRDYMGSKKILLPKHTLRDRLLPLITRR